MLDRLFLALLAFCVLAGGTLTFASAWRAEAALAEARPAERVSVVQAAASTARGTSPQ